MIYYTSDLHLGNSNIIGYENRPWKTVDEMDQGLIDRWNSRVKDKDKVYVLGDFCFKGASKAITFLEQLKGEIHLIRGNHDHFMGQLSFQEWSQWDSMAMSAQRPSRRIINEGWYKHFEDSGREVVLCHFPIMYWDGMDDRGSYHLYGHMHSRPNKQHTHPMTFNVGVDVNDYYPVTLDELLGRRKK